MAEVEEDTPEALEKRQRLMWLLVQGVTLEKNAGRGKVRTIYYFGPPSEAGDDGAGSLASYVPNAWEEFCTSPTNVLTLTTITVILTKEGVDLFGRKEETPVHISVAGDKRV